MTSDNDYTEPDGEQPQEAISSAIAAELSQIADRIVTLAEEGIRQRGYHLLSALGAGLGNDFQKIKLRTHLKLAEFITRYLGNRYEVKSPPQYGTGVLAVYRVGVEPASVPVISRGVSTVDVQFRYHHRFWAAFAVPMQDGQRFLDTHEFTFRDVSADEVPLGDTVVITPDFIPAPNIENRDKLIREQIDRWLAANGWGRERVAAKRPLIMTSGDITPSRSLLHAVVDALDRRQLQSLTMPLDVIA